MSAWIGDAGGYRSTLEQRERWSAKEVHQIKQVASAAHFDETGGRIDGKLWRLHVVCTNLLTYYAPAQTADAKPWMRLASIRRSKARLCTMPTGLTSSTKM
jgi:hypothetical protein